MPEELDGRLEFGGRITRTQWNEIVRRQPLLADLNPVTGQFIEPIDDPDVLDVVEVRLQPAGVYIRDPAAEWGHFEVLESYLREQGIPYDRSSSANGEFDAEEASFRPGMEDEILVVATQDGIVISAETVLDYLGNGLTLDEVLGSQPNQENTPLWLVGLRRNDPLPPFEFIED